jgi:hypothetical protein
MHQGQQRSETVMPQNIFRTLLCMAIGCLCLIVSGCGPAAPAAKKPVSKKVGPTKVAVAQAKPATETQPKPAQTSGEPGTSKFTPRLPATVANDDAPSKPRPAGSVSDLLRQGAAQEFAAPAFDEGKIATAGIRKLTGKHLILYTDVPATVVEIEQLPALFDAAVPLWAKYFEVDLAQLADWKIVGCLMKSKERFQGAGLYTRDLPDFPHGFQKGSQVWLFDQPSDYYRRHLLLHEGTHAFMNRWLGGAGPPWYMEGMAELLGTHEWDGRELKLGYNPPDKTQVPYWGRVKIIKDEFAAQKGQTLYDIFRYDAQAHLKNEAYGWCWGAAAFLNDHPLTREPFQELRRNTQDRSIEFSRRFHELLKPEWNNIAEDWQLFIVHLDYGYDIARAATVRKPGQPLAAGGATVNVAADRLWQSTGVQVDAGKTYELAASGRFTLAQQPQPWISEPGGVTIEYYGGMPLGILLAAVSDPANPGAGMTPLANPLPIGLARQITPKFTGTLYLCLNDSPAKLADNQGAVSVQIRSAQP